MEFGLFNINSGPCADPGVARDVAQAAEAAGFDSLWTGEHVVLPDPHQPPSPAPPGLAMSDPATHLAFVAAHTERIALATGIIILPQRNPLVLAKQLATLDVLSGGRLWFGYAAGYLHQEFAALGVPFADRGRRCDEYIEAMVELWSAEKPSFVGDYVSFSDIDAHPRPVQEPHPRLIVGGGSPPAFRRALRRAHGWYGFALDVDGAARAIEQLDSLRAGVDRPDELGDLEITITPLPGPLTDETVAAYAELGVSRLVVLPLARTGDEVLELVESTSAAHLAAAS